MNTHEAFEKLKKTMQDEPDFAWAWHCNIAVSIQDEGVDHATANRAANRFMRLCFEVDSKEPRSV